MRDTTNVKAYELTCKCGCGKENMTQDTVDRVQAARTIAGIAFHFSSGTRCPVHNKAEGGKDDSEHKDGEGVDIRCSDSRSRFIIVNALFDAGFQRIGISKDFIHAGASETKDQQVLFLY